MTNVPTIALITDFGCADSYAGIVRGVRAAPAAAKIANGEDPSGIGREVTDIVNVSCPVFSGNPDLGWTVEIL